MRWDNAEIVERKFIRPWAEQAPLLIRCARDVTRVEYDPDTKQGEVVVVLNPPPEGQSGYKVKFELRDDPEGGPPNLVVTS